MELVVRFPRPHAGQAEVLGSAGRFNVLACGRRWGKTELGMNRALTAALEGLPVAWGAPHYKFLAEPFREMRRRLGLVAGRASEEARRIELRTGGSVDFWTLDDLDAGRGMKYGLWVIDEAAMVVGLETVFWESVRPTLTDLEGSAWFLSTPKGRGFFWQLFRRGVGGDEGEADWRSWQMGSATNPHLSVVEIEAARGGMPASAFAQEYEAAFLESEGRVFVGVRDCVDVGRSVGGHLAGDRLAGGRLAGEGAGSGGEYVAGVDLARVQDWTVITVLDRSGTQVWHERFRGASWERQVGRVAEVCSRFVCRAVVDSTGLGDVVVERLRGEGVEVTPFVFSGPRKEELVQRLAMKLERGELRLMDVGVQTDELLDYEYRGLGSGRVRTGAPAGGHDDCVMALGLAVWGLGSAGRYDVFVL